jgi:hypothetical protein
MDEAQEIESHTAHGANGTALDTSQMGPSSPAATGRTLIQTPNGTFELPDDPALIFKFRDAPRPEPWQEVLARLRAENKMLADVRGLIQDELKRIKSEPAQVKKGSLKKREAAAYLSISLKRLFGLRDRGEIDVVRGGATTPQLFPIDSLDRWLRENAERF